MQEGAGEMVYFDESKYTGDWKENKVCSPDSFLQFWLDTFFY